LYIPLANSPTAESSLDSLTQLINAILPPKRVIRVVFQYNPYFKQTRLGDSYVIVRGIDFSDFLLCIILQESSVVLKSPAGMCGMFAGDMVCAICAVVGYAFIYDAFDCKPDKVA